MCFINCKALELSPSIMKIKEEAVFLVLRKN